MTERQLAVLTGSAAVAFVGILFVPLGFRAGPDTPG
jgi:hypothetical protein